MLAVLLPLLAAAAQTPGDPLTGVWEGRGKGDNPIIPPEGFAFTLVMEARGEDEALVTLTMGEANAKPAEASFDGESGELEFRCDLMGILVDVEFVIAGEEMTGKASGLGMSVELAGKRSSKELPSKEEPRALDVDLTTLPSEAWREDLRFLSKTLPEKHANAFHALTREDWDERVRALDAKLPALSPAVSAVSLAQLVAAVGDAHTELGLASTPFNAYFPVRFAWFADGLFVTGVDERFEDVLAARVRRIGNLDVAQALKAVCTLFACENDSWPRAKAPSKLAIPALVAALGVTTDSAAIPLVVAGADGTDLAVTIDGSGSGKWLEAPDPAVVPTPLWLQQTQAAYWFQVLPPAKAVYLAYNRCAEDPAKPIAGFMKDVFAALESSGAQKLVIDLRHNGGGNSYVLARFVPELAAHPRLAAPGSLRVLIGPKTYSSGMRNAAELRQVARARLYGEPTGGKPNTYGKLGVFRLPRSGLAVYHSTESYRQVEGDPPSLEPDMLVPLTSADYLAGADPVLERALTD